MRDRETRRINPIAHITMVLVMAVVFFEGFVIFGGLELRGRAVEKYAPWIHEPLRRLLGRHPEPKPRGDEEESGAEGMVAVNVAGLAPEAIPQLVETNAATTPTLEPSAPLETEAIPLPAPTNAPPSGEEEIVPVG